MLKLAALENNKNQDLEKKEGRIDDLLRVSVRHGVKIFIQNNRQWIWGKYFKCLNNPCF